MERISRIYGIQIKSLFVSLFLILSTFGFSQNDCMGTQSVVTNPTPAGGGYIPGQVVEFCVTFNNWNTGLGTNWCEGFDITVGAGWDLTTITPTTFPPNQGGNGSGGQWLWMANPFNGNPTSAGGAGNQFGPGFFFDLNTDGQTSDDWGDFGTGPWTFCFCFLTPTSFSLRAPWAGASCRPARTPPPHPGWRSV